MCYIKLIYYLLKRSVQYLYKYLDNLYCDYCDY